MNGHVGHWALPGIPRLLRKLAFGCNVLGKVLKAWYLENVDGHCRKRNYYFQVEHSDSFGYVFQK